MVIRYWAVKYVPHVWNEAAGGTAKTKPGLENGKVITRQATAEERRRFGIKIQPS